MCQVQVKVQAFAPQQLPTMHTTKKNNDKDTEARTNLSREDHENRNQFNELPNGMLKPSLEDASIWLDDDDRPWKLNAEPNAAYHQPMPLAIAFIRAYIGEWIPILKVPNLKFISPNNADGKFSEVCANRYTGELVIDQQILGTYNFCSLEDAPNAMKDGKLPTTGMHNTMDVVPHNEYGASYRHIAKGMEIGSVTNGPVILAKLENWEYSTICF